MSWTSSTLTAAARASPSRRPAAVITWCGSSPDAIAAFSSGADTKVSRQPRLPHEHCGPSSSTLMWPISPAAKLSP